MRTTLKKTNNLPQNVLWQPRNATRTMGNGSLFDKMLTSPVFTEASALNFTPLWLLLLVLLELPSFLVAAVADPHWVVPAAGGHGSPLLRTVITHPLAAGATVVDGETWGELPLAIVAGVDVLIRDPISRASCVLHQAWTQGRGISSCWLINVCTDRAIGEITRQLWYWEKTSTT